MKIGEKIKFLDHAGCGTIKEVRTQTVLVEDEFGFESEHPKNAVISASDNLEEALISMDLPTQEVRLEDLKPEMLEQVEIDLHIGHLVDFPKQYTAHEKFEIQLQTAKDAIMHYRHKAKKLILIHGKGNGSLEKAVLEILKNTSKINYRDADFKRYKLGAVEIQYV